MMLINGSCGINLILGGGLSSLFFFFLDDFFTFTAWIMLRADLMI